VVAAIASGVCVTGETVDRSGEEKDRSDGGEGGRELHCDGGDDCMMRLVIREESKVTALLTR